MRHGQKVWWVILAALLLALFQTQAAFAAEGAVPEDAVPDGAHCVVALEAVPAGATADSGSASQPTCFQSFADAIEYATAGRVVLPESATTVSEKQLQAAGAVSTRDSQVARPLLGIEYQHTDYGGESLVLYGASGSGCYAGVWYGFPDLGDLGFNNRISSARMYSNCLGKHHDGTHYTGTYRYCDSSCPSLGAMNDRTSSIKFI